MFDLIEADTLDGDFEIVINGLDAETLSRLAVVQTDQLLRLSFAVPEPSVCLTAVIAFGLLALRRRG